MKPYQKYLLGLGMAGSLHLTACTTQTNTNTETMTTAQQAQQQVSEDVHSYAEPTKAVARHLDLDIAVNFDSKTIRGTAS